MRSQRRRSRGAVSLELVLLTPIFLLLLDVAVYGGRLTASQSQVDAAAHAAARAASLQRSASAATAAADQVATDTLAAGGGPSCVAFHVTVDTTAFRAGGTVTATVQCDIAVHDLSWLPLPGTRTVTGNSTSAIDVYRSTSP